MIKNAKLYPVFGTILLVLYCALATCTRVPDIFIYNNQFDIKHASPFVHRLLLLVTHAVPVTGYLWIKCLKYMNAIARNYSYISIIYINAPHAKPR
jgi:hypothetical protein